MLKRCTFKVADESLNLLFQTGIQVPPPKSTHYGSLRWEIFNYSSCWFVFVERGTCCYSLSFFWLNSKGSRWKKLWIGEEFFYRFLYIYVYTVLWFEVATVFYLEDLLFMCVWIAFWGIKFRPLYFVFNSMFILLQIIIFTGRAMPFFLCL